MSRNKSEIQLQTRLRSDDKLALEVVYKLHKNAFINYALEYDISKAAASDIYQDSIIAMYQNFVTNKLHLEKSTVKTYLFGIGKFKIYRFLNDRKKMVTSNSEQQDYEEITLEDHVPSELQVKLSENLKLISESCQNILKMFYYRGLSIEDIVEQTDYKDSNTVRSHKSRCMKRLKLLFKKN